jgi:hypothetical protein
MHHVVSEFLASLSDGLSAVLLSVVLLNPSAWQILRQFRQARALTPDSAQPFHPQSPQERRAFDGLLRLTIIRQAHPGRYFLDERALRGWRLP